MAPKVLVIKTHWPFWDLTCTREMDPVAPTSCGAAAELEEQLRWCESAAVSLRCDPTLGAPARCNGAAAERGKHAARETCAQSDSPQSAASASHLSLSCRAQ